MPRKRSLVPVAAYAVACAIGGCSDGGSDAASPSGVTPADTVSGADSTGAPASTGTPRYVDPAWTEPAGPDGAAVSSAVDAMLSAAATALGDAAVGQLEAEAKAQAPGALAYAYLYDLRVDAAKWLLSQAFAADGRPVSLVGLAALELLSDTGDAAERAALLARAALAGLKDAPENQLTSQRLKASAWSNLGHALLRNGQAAGAVHAFRQAAGLLPADPRYRIGLAASLSAAGLELPALLEAIRAQGLEEVHDHTLQGDPARKTSARAWKAHLAAKVADGVPFPTAAAPDDGKTDSAGDSFPNVGSSWLGMEITAKDPDGTLTVAAPPFEPHGPAHHSGTLPTCTVVAEGKVLDLKCAEVARADFFPIGLLGPTLEQRATEPGLTCENVFDRVFSPEPRAMKVKPTQDTAEAAASALNGAVLNELISMENSFGVPFGNAEVIERCVDFAPMASDYQKHYDTMQKGCSCSCETNPEECNACAATLRESCDALFAQATLLAVNERIRAFADDPIHQQNLMRYASMAPQLVARSLGKTECDQTCGMILSASPQLNWSGRVGGRSGYFLSLLPPLAPSFYLSCLQRIPPTCGESPDQSDPSKVPCVCLGAGVMKVCFQADGTVEVKAAAVLAVGSKVNLGAGLKSLRIGVGTDIGINVGPLGLGVSEMTWWNPNTNTWTSDGVSFDAGVAGPDGTGIGGNVGLCDAWKEGAQTPEGSADGYAVEVTPADP